jgi:hypothetical protein
MLTDGPGDEIAVRTKLNFLMENQLSHIKDFVLVLLSDVVSKCGFWSLAVEKHVYESIFAYLAAPNLSDRKLVTFTLEQPCLFTQWVLVQSDDFLVTKNIHSLLGYVIEVAADK